MLFLFILIGGKQMDQNERPEGRLTLDKDAQINVVVNQPDSEDTIDLGRVFHNMKLKSRVFAWVLVLCLVVGVSAPLLMYQFSKPMLTVSSAFFSEPSYLRICIYLEIQAGSL